MLVALFGGPARRRRCLRGHLHELGHFEPIPSRALGGVKWLARLEEWLAGRPGTQARIARDQIARLRELAPEIQALEEEISEAVAGRAQPLMAIPGCGPLTAAKLIGEIGDITALPARHSWHARRLAPIPASSGPRRRHRLSRHGNRQINAALHRIAVNQGRYRAMSSMASPSPSEASVTLALA